MAEFEELRNLLGPWPHAFTWSYWYNPVGLEFSLSLTPGCIGIVFLHEVYFLPNGITHKPTTGPTTMELLGSPFIGTTALASLTVNGAKSTNVQSFSSSNKPTTGLTTSGSLGSPTLALPVLMSRMGSCGEPDGLGPRMAPSTRELGELTSSTLLAVAVAAAI